MKRSVTVLLWILLGAAASGLGVGYFLHQANADRERLAQQARYAELTAEKTKEATDKIVAEANQKMAAASEEIAKAKKLISEQEQNQRLASQAIALPKPAARALARSKESISLPLGLSIWIPAGSIANVTDTTVIAALDPAASGKNDPWLVITPYAAMSENQMLQNVSSTAQADYAVGGRLLVGWRGVSRDLASVIYVLRVRGAATTTHLIWGKTNSLVNEKKILDTLATMEFRS